MKTKQALISLAVLAATLLAACGPAAAPPTATPTFYPVFPTNTPVPPTATLVPLVVPTNTPIPVSVGYRVIGGANCRENPNEDADIITTFGNGTILQSKGRTIDGTWQLVPALETDETCWIATKLLASVSSLPTYTAPAPAAPGEPVLFQALNVTNCRQGPDPLYIVSTVLEAGSTSTVVGRNQSEEWLLLTIPDGTLTLSCWVSARMGAVNGSLESLRITTMFRMDNQRGNCRQGPALYYPIETSYARGRYFIIHGRSADNRWLWIQRNLTTWHCWVSNELGVVDGPLDTIPVMTGVQVRNNASCYTGPGTVYPLAAAVPADTVLSIEGISPAGKYLYAVMPDGVQRCWVSADVGTLPGTLEGIQVVPPPAEPSPVIMLTTPAFCRAGPSMEYTMLTGPFDVDRVLIIIGKNADASWLQVQNPTTGPECWVSAVLGTLYGSLDAIPVVTVPGP